MFFGTKIMPSIECSIVIIDQYYENNHYYTIIMQQCKDLVISCQYCVDSHVTRNKCNSDNPC